MPSKKKILIVEDHEEFRKTLRTFLEVQKIDLIILEAVSKESAVTVALREKPDIILLKLELQNRNGFSASEAIKKVSPRSKIVLISMFGGTAFKKNPRAASIDDFIGNGELETRLISVLEKHLKRPRTPSGVRRKADFINRSREGGISRKRTG